VATAVICVATRRDMGEAYGDATQPGRSIGCTGAGSRYAAHLTNRLAIDVLEATVLPEVIQG
jgi:hypothetical protein